MNDRAGRQPWSHLISLPPLLHMRSFHTTELLRALSSLTQEGEGWGRWGGEKEGEILLLSPQGDDASSPLISAGSDF